MAKLFLEKMNTWCRYTTIMHAIFAGLFGYSELFSYFRCMNRDVYADILPGS